MRASKQFLSFLLSQVSEYYGLTAAHCFNTARNIANIGILVGDHDYSTGTDTPYPWVYKINQIIKHESYIPSSDNQNNDIALVKTTLPIKWKKTIGPACLPFIYIGYNTYFDGYALTGEQKFRSYRQINKRINFQFMDGAQLNSVDLFQRFWRKPTWQSFPALLAVLSTLTKLRPVKSALTLKEPTHGKSSEF